MANKRLVKKPVVFFDFDNTITMFDVLDDMLVKFSINDNWKKLEDEWKEGKIGSRECLKGQVEGVGITRKALDKYLSGIKIDPYFPKLVKLLNARGIKTFILSDNFEYILNKVLKDNEIKGLDVYANRLSITGGRLKPTFPITNEACGDCAHCKQTSLLKNTNIDSTSFYIGDGRSDICASQSADVVFAKGYLKNYCKKKKISHIPFNELKSVYKYFENVPDGKYRSLR